MHFPRAGLFLDTNMRTIEKTSKKESTGEPLHFTVRRPNGTYFAHCQLPPQAAAQVRRRAKKMRISIEEVLQRTIESAVRNYAA